MDPAALRPLGVGEILDVAIKIFRARFATLMKIVLVVVTPIAIVVALVQLSVTPDEDFLTETTTIEGTEEVDFDRGAFAGFLGAFVVTGILSWLATETATAACVKVVGGTYVDEDPSWRESLAFAARKLPSLLWLFLLTGFLLVLGFLACVIPGIYLYVAWSIATPVLILEDVRGRKALKRSRQLMKGRWWGVAIVLLVSTLLASVVGFVFGAVASGIVFISGDSVTSTIADGVANTLGTLLVTPFTAAVITVVYFDLRVRKEGFDIELLARDMGVDPPPNLPPPPPRDDRGWPDDGPPTVPPGWDPPDA